jgi:hypothetical protein
MSSPREHKELREADATVWFGLIEATGMMQLVEID